ncbi:DNA-directed RNA polymerase subunit K [Candidatus Woesearchaeota archaeon]|nr:DNA-directed RNA polymerase subunit K [Candidatus Woesearchaeota archaeon]
MTEQMTKYEKARILGSRALQIAMGAPFLVKIDKEEMAKIKFNPIEIAKKELEKGLIPIAIVKKLPVIK